MKIKRFMVSCVAVAITLSSCRAGDASSVVTKKTVKDSQANKVTAAVPSDEQAERKKTTTATKEAVTTTATTAEPEAYDDEAHYNHNVSIDGFEQITSNDELDKLLDRLDEISYDFGYNLAFSYQNCDTGATIEYNAYSWFLCCSIIKAPFVKSILADGIDLNDKIIRDDIWNGDTPGVDYIASINYGTELTAKELIEACIQRSDNTAYYLLKKHYGADVFNSNSYNIGANITLGTYSPSFPSVTSSAMLKMYVDMYEFAEKDENGLWLTDLMTDTDVNMQIGKALDSKYKVSQKYGSEFYEVVFNDCAIVYADSPFVLCILSNQYPETEQSSEVFIELAEIFDEINQLICQ